jgi:hypothetical protein
MRILICTKRDLEGTLFLNQALPALAGHEIVGVWLSDKNRQAEDQVAELAQLRFLERTLPIDLVFPLIDQLLPGTQAQPPQATLRGLEARYGLHTEVVDSVNGPAARARMAALAPDLVLVARFSHLFDADTIAIPPQGILNIHPGHLPEYAGLYAPMRAITDGRSHFGTSIHWITPGIDDGPLVQVIPTPIRRNCCLLCQSSGLYLVALPAILDILEACTAGQRPSGKAQDRRLRRYRSLPSAAEFDALARQGMLLWEPDSYLQTLNRFLPPGMTLPELPLPPIR